jgi:hypothetical protein
VLAGRGRPRDGGFDSLTSGVTTARCAAVSGDQSFAVPVRRAKMNDFLVWGFLCWPVEGDHGTAGLTASRLA